MIDLKLKYIYIYIDIYYANLYCFNNNYLFIIKIISLIFDYL